MRSPGWGHGVRGPRPRYGPTVPGVPAALGRRPRIGQLCRAARQVREPDIAWRLMTIDDLAVVQRPGNSR